MSTHTHPPSFKTWSDISHFPSKNVKTQFCFSNMKGILERHWEKRKSYEFHGQLPENNVFELENINNFLTGYIITKENVFRLSGYFSVFIKFLKIAQKTNLKQVLKNILLKMIIDIFIKLYLLER